MASALPIRPLPPNVVAQLKSSIAITSLNAVVIELFKNSLDASSGKINISIEYPRGSCTVEDDGLGILPSEFLEDGGLAKPYHTSKQGSPYLTYGRNGEFIASLADLSLMTITSCHSRYRSCNAITICHSRVISRQTPCAQPILPSDGHGTCVTVRDLFGNMPVRVKQRAMGSTRLSSNWRDWEELRTEVTSISMAWPYAVHVIVRDSVTGEKISFRNIARCRVENGCKDQVSVEHICSTLWQAKMISTPEKALWVSVSASTRELFLTGAFSVDPAPTKGTQFISLGIHPLRNQDGRHSFFEEINELFAGSTFGNNTMLKANGNCHTDDHGKGVASKFGNPSRKSLNGTKKGIERWPMFVIMIDTVDDSRIDSLADFENGTRAEDSWLASIKDLLRATTVEFLQNQLYLPRGRRRCRDASEPVRSVSSGPDFAKNITKKRRGQDHAEAHRSATSTYPAAGYSKGGHDLLGIDVKLPSFKHGTLPQSQSPFDGWSRVKSGQGNSAINTPSKVNCCPIDKAGAPSSSYLSADCLGSASIVAKSGQITQLPFEESSRPQRSAIAHRRSNFTVHTPHSGKPAGGPFDSSTTWTNPVTKESSLLNQRTGMVLRTAGPPSSANFGISKGPDRQDKGRSKFGQGMILHANDNPELSSWVRDIVAEWDNPVFPLTEVTIPRASPARIDQYTQRLLHSFHDCSQEDMDRAFEDCSAGSSGRFSRTALGKAEIISQVELKFIIIKIASDTASYDVAKSRHTQDVLAIIDQHAADERCRIEQLMAELCTKPNVKEHNAEDDTIKSGIVTTHLERPLCIKLPHREWTLLCTQLQHFANWGILFGTEIAPVTSSTTECEVKVVSLPPGIVERCKAVPKLLVDLVRLEIWKQAERQAPSSNTTSNTYQMAPGEAEIKCSDKHAWVKEILHCPQGILDMLNSRACRSAIMFNDELSFDQCRSLVLRLADCAFPFQCAHGRPSIVPLVDMGTIKRDERDMSDAKGTESFGQAFKKWKHI